MRRTLYDPSTGKRRTDYLSMDYIFNSQFLDEDCQTIAENMEPVENLIKEALNAGLYERAIKMFLELVDADCHYFIKDEHWCYFDDMYVPDYELNDLLRKILENRDKMTAKDLDLLQEGLEKASKSEAYQDYGYPYCCGEKI